jgi:predicted nucleic acid-binding protein
MAVQQIDLIRRALGGSARLPTQHLGEAQTIYHIGNVEPNAVFATDDRDAYNTALRKNLRVIDTPDILNDCYEARVLGCPEAYELLHKMAASGRGVAIPESHWYICPANVPE